MKERPILFSAPMVRAILEGRKTVTRRIVKPPRYLKDLSDVVSIAHTKTVDFDWWHMKAKDGHIGAIRCPYEADRLWVRETWYDDAVFGKSEIFYRADGSFDEQFEQHRLGSVGPFKWRPSIHMPRAFSRLSLEVTGIRVERLQDITPEEAAAEGLIQLKATGRWVIAQGDQYFDLADHDPRRVFRRLWESINGPGSWDLNPWVWAVEFRKVAP